MELKNTAWKFGKDKGNKMTLTKTYWDYDEQVERCVVCNKIILDVSHECEEPYDEENYSSKLKFGFDLLDMEG